MIDILKPSPIITNWVHQGPSNGYPSCFFYSSCFHYSQALLVVDSAGSCKMNSLAYLSRQFDVLASPRTPPSTPTSEQQQPFHPDRRSPSATETPLPHAKTWSTKSFLFSPQPNSAPTKRSYSFPLHFISFAKRRPHPDSSPTVSIEMQVVPKETFHTLFNRIVLVRVLVLAWDALQSVWTSWIESRGAQGRQTMSIRVVAASSEKDSTDEDTDDPSLLPAKPAPPLLQDHLFPSVLRDPKSSSSSSPPEISSATHSRSSTPSLTTRKTPFHLPKTLVLDLDETLIHSTSRPIPSSSTGSGFFGLSALTRRNKSSGHVVEVVMGGRSTLYHVYKRPFVDFFLRTVRSIRFLCSTCRNHAYYTGFGMVHARDIYCINARIRRSRNRLARRWPRDPFKPVI